MRDAKQRKRNHDGSLRPVSCPFCPIGKPKEARMFYATQNHATSHCVAMQGYTVKRHNMVLDLLEKALKKLKRYVNFRKEPRVEGGGSHQKPDLVFQMNSQFRCVTYVVDPMVVTCDSEFVNLDDEHLRKSGKYNNNFVRSWIDKELIFPSDKVFTAAVLDNRGCWSDRSYREMRDLGISDDFLESISIEVLAFSHSMVIEWGKLYNKRVRN